MSRLIFVFLMVCGVSMAHYLKPTCGINEKYSNCLKHCDSICPANEEKICSRMCEPGCICIDGYSRTKNFGICIPTDKCPTASKFFEIFENYFLKDENDDINFVISKSYNDDYVDFKSGDDNTQMHETETDVSSTSASINNDFTTIESSTSNEFSTTELVNNELPTTTESIDDNFSTITTINDDVTIAKDQ